MKTRHEWNTPMRNQTAAVVNCVRLLALAIATAAMSLAGAAAAAAELRIGGTGNALGTMHLLASAFGKQNPDLKVTVLPSVGSSGAIKAVPKGAIDIGLTSRPLTEEESKPGTVAVEYARTPLVFAVSAKSPVTALTLDQIADIYNGRMMNWPDGSQIRPVLRQAGDDNTRQIRQVSPALDKALSAAEKRPGMAFATIDQEAAEKTESIPGALGVTTLSLIISENRPLRTLTLDGVEPTVGNASSGKYPLVKRFYLITRTDQSAAVKLFIAFVRSPAGREILIRSGNWIP
jgi:phosphate transport system substrate-binding protein